MVAQALIMKALMATLNMIPGAGDSSQTYLS